MVGFIFYSVRGFRDLEELDFSLEVTCLGFRRDVCVFVCFRFGGNEILDRVRFS